MMIKWNKSKWPGLVFALSLAAATPLFAQNGPPGGGGGPGGPGGDPNGGPGGRGGGPPSFAEHKQHELQDIQEDLNLTETQWKDLEPKIEKLIDLHEELSPHHGPPRPDEENKSESPVEKALNDLRDALDDKDAKAEDIKAKVDAYEKVKAAVADEIKKAEDDLSKTLTPIEQAILIARGVLD